MTPELSSEERKHLLKRVKNAGLVVSAVSAHVNIVQGELEKCSALSMRKGTQMYFQWISKSESLDHA